MRALQPDVAEHLRRDGIDIGYEVFGTHHDDHRPTVLLMPAWTIVHSRFWKLQVPYLARHFRVITYDGPGNGRSGRTTDPRRYTLDNYAHDAAAVLDTCGVERAVVVGVSMGVPYSLRLASIRADLVAGLVLVAAALPLAVHPERAEIAARIGDPAPESPDGWDRYNIAYWHAHYDEFVDWFFHQVFPESHSTKAHEDATGWARETDPTILDANERAPRGSVDTRALLAAVRCPALWIHGDDDRVLPHAVGVAGAAATETPLVTIVGGGHLPNLRDPVRFNLLLRDFVERSAM